MRLLLWQWGRFGGAPRFATFLAQGLASPPDVEVILSLSRGAEILRETAPPRCDLPVTTYDGRIGFLARAAMAPFSVRALARRVAETQPDLAICTHPSPLDLLMATALQRLKIPFVVIVHDADAHPGDGFPLQMWLQRQLCRRANAVAALTSHVAARLRAQNLAGTPGHPLILLHHPPMPYTFSANRDEHGGPFQLLAFGRLLPYKGLDLLADCLTHLGGGPHLSVRVVGSGPESAELDALRALPGVTVENRWVPEAEVGALFSWADAVVLPYREASQSGVAAVALAAGRYIVATNVGGLAEQLLNEPLAILCQPDGGSLADAIRGLLEAPPAPVPPTPADTMDGWRELGRSLLVQTEPLLRAAQRP